MASPSSALMVICIARGSPTIGPECASRITIRRLQRERLAGLHCLHHGRARGPLLRFDRPVDRIDARLQLHKPAEIPAEVLVAIGDDIAHVAEDGSGDIALLENLVARSLQQPKRVHDRSPSILSLTENARPGPVRRELRNTYGSNFIFR